MCYEIYFLYDLNKKQPPAKNPEHFGDLVQDSSNSIANALELMQPCDKPSICTYM